MPDRIRVRRLRKAELKLADVQYELDQFGWAWPPSTKDYYERLIVKRARKVRRLGGGSDV